MIESINAITLATYDMGQAVRFYQTLGFDVIYGGAEDKFTSSDNGVKRCQFVVHPTKIKHRIDLADEMITRHDIV